jgi:flagellar basal-body rod protein FlgB
VSRRFKNVGRITAIHRRDRRIPSREKPFPREIESQIIISLGQAYPDKIRASQSSILEPFMEPIRLLDVASQQAHWLATRQAVIAENVANINSPGYVARDVKPFSEVLDTTQLQLAATNPSHITLTGAAVPSESLKPSDNWEVTNSGNSISVEQQMMEAGDVNRAYSLNTNIVKAFHGMLMSSVKASG